MDDPNQKQKQDQSQPQQQADDNVKPVSPVSSRNVEAGPIQASDREPILHPEVAASGVEVVKDKPELTEEHDKIGVKAAAESTPVSTEPSGKVQIPMSEEEVKAAIKEGPGNDVDVQKQFEGIYFANAKYFLARLFEKILRRNKKD